MDWETWGNEFIGDTFTIRSTVTKGAHASCPCGPYSPPRTWPL